MPTIPIYNKCNNNCIMCTNPDNFLSRKEGFSLDYLLRRIDRFYNGENEFSENYKDKFSITGGEPTLSAHLIKIIEKINSLFANAKISCLTNGRKFSYACYAKEILMSADNLELILSIHGHSPKIHDRITRVAGSFSQTIRGLENILKFKNPSQLIEIRLVIHALNYKSLQEIIKFIKSNFPKFGRLVFIFFEMEGQACKNIKTLKLTYSQLLPYLDKAYEAVSYFPEVRFYHFPLCVLPAHYYPYVWRTLPDYEVSFSKKCGLCSLKGLCAGIHNGYAKYVGFKELHAFKDKILIEESKNWHHPIKKINNG